MNKEALIIFVKNPELGKVKTRLAATVGNEQALEIYKELLHHTKAITKNLKQDVWVFYSSHIESDDLWENQSYFKKVQSSGDLGEKMLDAFEFCFSQGYERVCIIGSDLMDIDQHLIEGAFDVLKENDTVIGPAVDGGYYLLGMTQLHTFLFINKAWSTKTVLSDTINDLKSYDLSYSLLDEKNDIDTEGDWEAVK